MTVVRLLTLWLVAATIPMLATPAAAAEASSTKTPLSVRLLELTPSTVPAKGRVVLAGTVTNDDTQVWQDINVAPFVGSTPLTSSDELAQAAASDPAATVGTRLTAPGTFDPIGDLQVGQTKTFRISLRRSALPINQAEPGVYWIGVHALGTNAEGRDGAADGRARTFIPLVTGKKAHASASLVVPLRAKVRRDRTGRLANAGRWSSLVTPDGRLDRVVDFGSGRPVTWLVDPAVLDAAQSLADGNPALSLGDRLDPDAQPSSTPSATATPTTGAGAVDEVTRSAAAAWLGRAKAATTSGTVLGLGYADPDVAALARLAPGLISRSLTLAADRFKALGLPETPVAAPPSGYLDSGATKALPSDATVLLSDHGKPSGTAQWSTAKGQALVFADGRSSSGGPGPTPRLDALALRQRMLAEAALRALAGDDSPAITLLPPHWDPGANWRSAQFFKGLDVNWLSLVPLSPTGSTTYPHALPYPDAERSAEIGAANVAAARRLVRTGTVLGQLLATSNDVAQALTGAALSATSYDARSTPVAAVHSVDALNAALRERMDAVKVTGTRFVTLSGSSGSLTVTLVNDLAVPVTVGLRARVAQAGVTIDAPKPVKMGPGQRTTLRLSATASSIGVHQVTLTPVTTKGRPLGTALEFSLRTSSVGRLIWVVLIAGGLLLTVMIIRRILRRVRGARP